MCSERYFERYFSYSVPPDDIADLEVAEFLECVKTADDLELDGKFRDFGERIAITRLIEKIRRRENNVDLETCPRLASAIARNGSLLPRDRGMLLPDWTFMQAAILIRNMIGRASKNEDRAQLAQEITAEADPLPFAFECFRWIRKDKDQAEADRLVSPEIEEELAHRLKDRIHAAADKEPLYKTFGTDAPALFWAWNKYGGEGGVEEYLRNRFEKDSSEIDDFLNVYVATAWGMESGLSHKADFDRGNYDAVAKLIDPDLIMTKLRQRYGKELDDPQFHHSDETPLPRRVAHQFAFIHKGIQDTKQKEDTTPPETDG